jgi:hypothetical protein
MPCANTSGMPAACAISWSRWIGLMSPEAPANSESVVREIGSILRAGSSVPTAMSAIVASSVSPERCDITAPYEA